MGLAVIILFVIWIWHVIFTGNRIEDLAMRVENLEREKAPPRPTLKERIATREEVPLPPAPVYSPPPPPAPPVIPTPPIPVPVPVPIPVPTPAPVLEVAQTVTPIEDEWNLGDFLRRIHLLPPLEAGGNTEVRLASWWATRVGILLGVIAAVFFGVYVSKNASPAIRLVELTAVAAGMVALGLRLERSMAAFGRVITAGGLAMLYVSAFGAYAFSPMKVTDSPALGLVLQLLGASVVFGFSLWKRSEALATMAVLLGLVSCWFSHAYSLQPFPLIGLVLFALIGSGLFIWKRWIAPLVVAFAGSYLGYAMLIAFDWRFTQGPGWPALLGSILLLLAVFHVAVQSGRRGELLNWKWRTAGTMANVWAAMIAGGVAIRILEPAGWGWFCLAMGLLLLVFAAEEYFGPRLEGIWVPLFLFAGSAFALFFFEHLSGSPLWMALSLEAGLVIIAMHYTRSVWMERFFFLFWLVATISYLFGFNWTDWTWSFDNQQKLAGVSFLLMQTCTLSVYRRYVLTLEPPHRKTRYHWIGWLAAGTGLLLFLQLLAKDLPDLCISIAVAGSVAALALALRAWPPLVVSAVALAFLPLNFLFLADNENMWHYLAGAGLLAAGLTAAELLQRCYRYELGCQPLYRFLAMLQAAVMLAILLFHRVDDATWATSSLLEHAGWSALAAILVGWHAIRRRGHPVTEPGVVLGHCYAFLVSCLLLMALSTANFPSVAWASAGAIFFLTCFATRSAAPVSGGVLLMLAGYLTHLFMPGANVPPWHAPFLAVLAFGAALVHHLRVPRSAFSPAADFILHVLWMSVIGTWFGQTMPLEWVIAACAGLSLAVYLVSIRFPFSHLKAASLAPVFWGLGLTHSIWTQLPALPLWVAAACLLAAWLTHRLVTGTRDGMLHWILGPLTVILAMWANHVSLPVPWELMSGAALGLALIGIWRMAELRPAGILGAGVLAGTAIQLLQLRTLGEPTLEALLATAGTVLCILLAGLILAVSHWDKFGDARSRIAAAWGFPGTGLVVTFLFLAWPGSPVFGYATPLWGFTGILIFAAGLGFRLRAWRIVGLAGLTFCVGRVFLVDLQETFYRIVAFGAVAVLLLAIGYLYTRFREFIERGEV